MEATRTKVIATLGPALDPPGALERLIEAGVDVLRVNLSHARAADHAERVARARAIKPQLAVLADLGGPKLRLGELSSPVTVVEGQDVVLGSPQLPIADPSFAERVRPGDPIYLVDGAVRMEAIRISGAAVECRVIVGGALLSRKGINLPNDRSNLPALTDKDRRDITELHAIEPDYVAVSYVRHENDIEEARRLTSLPIVAKIEKQQALERMDSIIAACDAIMVARGDLGVEIPIEKVPAAQKRLIRAANLAGRPVITATQMLVSMVTSSLPTRAEVTDVANAVLDGTDAVMLSEETAIGRDPAGAVAMMERLLRETEQLLVPTLHPTTDKKSHALAEAATRLAENLHARALLAPTKGGITAQRLAAFRPHLPILGFSKHMSTIRRLALVWGVSPHPLPPDTDDSHPADATIEAARRLLPPQSLVVLLSLPPIGSPITSSYIRALTI